jgi:hypothetical protein
VAVYHAAMRSIPASVVLAVAVTCSASCHSARHAEPDRALVESRNASVDRTDGVSRDEAIAIAQHHMLANGHDRDWFVEPPENVSEEADCWTVTFQPREDGWGSGDRPESELTLTMLMPYWIQIDKDDGTTRVMLTIVEPGG